MASKAVALTNGGDKANRRELDFYPTPAEVTIALMDFLKLNPDEVIWEPACGTGSMSDVLKQYNWDVISTDVADLGYGTSGVDFISEDARYECDVIITNPPFNLSEQFIRKALSIAPVVAMLLKSQYWHAKKRIILFEECTPTWILPLTWRPDFLFDQREPGERSSPTMDCMWVVWKVGETEANYRPLDKPNRKESQ